jgi:hypothetical protein
MYFHFGALMYFRSGVDMPPSALRLAVERDQLLIA